MKLGTIPIIDFKKLNDLTQQPTTVESLLIRLILETGCRTDEALKIRPRDINLTLKKVQIYGSKNSHDRSVVLSDEAIKAIRAITHLESIAVNSTFISAVTLSTERKCQRIVLQRALRKMTTYLNLPHYTLHQLRHTCFDAIYQALGDVLAVMQFAGHKSINSTLEYVHHNAREKAQSSWSALIAKENV